MERVQQGETDRLELLMQRHQRPLFALAVRWLRDRQAAEDAFQETFLRVFRKRASYRKGSPFRPWLYRICLNLCRDELRRRGRRPEIELPPGLELADCQPGPELQLEAESQRAEVRAAVAGLPEKQREVFELVHYQSLPYAEVSQIVDIPVGTVKSRMFHALRQLAARLRNQPE